jgi:hypothetical protein
VPCEAVRSTVFQEAYDRLTPEKQWEVTWAVDEIEQDPGWKAGQARFLGPADSVYSGFIVDFSVEGYGIVYKVVDHGAAAELWYLYSVPPPPKAARVRRTGPIPLM